DENHTSGNNHSTEEFKDAEGRVILKRTYNAGVKHDTYYVYDDYGNLSFVLPPLMDADTEILVNVQASLDELGYQYVYDYRNRLVEKKIPGKGWEYIVYNKLDQPIMTQDANLDALNTWLFTKYDAFGRVTYTGEIDRNASRTTLQNEANSATSVYENKLTTPITLASYAPVYYSNNAYPNTNISEVNTINYYDNYTFNRDGGQWQATAYGVTSIVYPKGLATGSKVRVLGTTEFITSVTHYDDKARPINVYSNNPYLDTVDEIKSEFAFDGTVTETTTTHARTGFSTITTVDTFSYDHMNRLIDQQQTINGGTAEVIVENTYDELGQLESKGVGGPSTGSGTGVRLQTVDYTYNIRGWLKEINDVANLGTDLFGFKINYNEQEGAIQFANLYNGNISQTIWKTANDNEKRGYSYEYDDLNRIDRGIMRKGDNLDVYTRHHLRSVSYDKNGNIVTLQRDSNVNIMDDLTYTYDGNQLLSVTDANTTHLTEGFIDGNTSGNDYTYDANGNMLRDYNKGISSDIVYNHLNLPESISINGNGNNGTITYIYDATGVKQKKIVSNGTTTYYAGNYIYEGSALKFFSHPEGYIEPNGSNFDYVYQYKDHLGNIRLAYSDTNNNGSVNSSEIKEENNYYPFGLQHKGYNNVVSSNSNSVARKFKYNGKELEKALGYKMYEYEARHYDAALARFVTIDPLAEDYSFQSSYVYAVNDPVRFIDKLGMSPDDVILRGANGSSITLVTDLVDLDIDASSLGVDFGGNYSFDGEDILVAGLDIAGIFDPTGAADIAAGSIEMKNGNFWSGIASYAGVAPLIGDTAKLGKIPKHLKTINKAIDGVKNQKKIAKAKRGKGSVDPSKRDPRRTYTKKEKQKKLDEQGGKCKNCGEQKTVDQVDGHHRKRHADGGRTTEDNLEVPCKSCHKKIHSKD
uniref:RHS repeat-associated core domain-containing protein n=1 Tax=uncultured Winogradskyella sp. TaxID=395353 RepID=UPI00261DC130